LGKRNKKVDFNNVIKNKKLPILTLDIRWHELFPENEKTSEIRELEQNLNNLLKKQGKLVNDIKDMKKLKNNLLNDIMVNMDISSDPVGRAKEKKLDKNKQYINELNLKISEATEELSEIPYQIKEANEQLMIASMNICYNHIAANKEEIGKIAAWIADIREDLKNKILIKQDMEIKNTLIYTYMHDVLGAELMEGFDAEHSKKALD
jgi:ElaB/YqjD/DUF883 family membrane-anchored ribosome-binding protein